MKNESGQMTLDFLFGSTMVIGIAVALSALCFSLTLVEVIQYTTFSAARAYYAADRNEQAQRELADSKAQSLFSGANALPFLAGAYANGWITVANLGAKNYGDYYGQLGANLQRNQFVGVQFQIEFPILNLKLPLLGAAIEPPDGAFRSKVSSFLMREPSFDECRELTNTVYRTLIDLHQPFNRAAGLGGGNVSPQNFQAIIDNGC